MNPIEIIESLDKIDDEAIVVGVSAGPDSMALLHMLINHSKKKIICAHINHNVRKESKLEAEYLGNYCKEHGIIFEKYTINKYKESNFENEARNKRYLFYEKVLKKYHSHTLMLAHHGDDLTETVIMKIMRGSNLEGYAGIKMYSKVKDYTIIRPLLSLDKEAILKYNKEFDIKYYIDNTNNDETYTRNRIRKNILPILKHEDKNIHKKMLKYSNSLQEYYNYVEDITLDKLKEMYKHNKLDLNEFNNEHSFIKKSIIFYILSDIYNNEANIIKDKHIIDILSICHSNKPNLSISLPRNIIVRKEFNYLIFEKKKDTKKYYKEKFNNEFKIDNLIIKKIDKTNENGNNICKLNSANIKLPLYIRNKRPGDKMSVLGLNGTKKIKDIFIDSKVPRTKRDSYPLLVDANDNILWIPNIKKSKYNTKLDEFYDIILYSYESEEKDEKQKKSN